MAIIGDKGVEKIEEALCLIRSYDPLRYKRLLKDVSQIFVTVLPASIAQWVDSMHACELDERYLLNQATTPQHIASTIVHEATHARLHRRGIGYDEELRDRVERVCLRRELAFASKLPISMARVDGVKRTLDAMPDLSDKGMAERYLGGILDALLYLGTPRWLAHLLVAHKRWRHRRRFGTDMSRRNASVGDRHSGRSTM